VTPLRAYLFVQNAERTVEVSVHRDLEDLAESCKTNIASSLSIAVHIGFSRPDTCSMSDLLGRFQGYVLLSSTAKFSLLEEFTSSEEPVGVADGISFYLALSGWGYEARRNKTESESVDSSQYFATDVRVSEPWLNRLMSSKPDWTAVLLEAGILDDETYWQFESLIESPVRAGVGMFRFEFLRGSDEENASILDSLRFAPPWFLSLPVSVLAPSNRCRNVFKLRSVSRILDLASYGTKGMRTCRNVGRKTLNEIEERLQQVLMSGPGSPEIAPYLRAYEVPSYQTRDSAAVSKPVATVRTSLSVSPSRFKAPIFPDSLWVDSLAYMRPELFARAIDAGVSDEESYVASESGLPLKLRFELGGFRFLHLCGCKIQAEQILDYLSFAPPWFLSLPTSVLVLSVRSENVLLNNSIYEINHLLAFDTGKFRKLRNLGAKSFREITDGLYNILDSGPMCDAVAHLLIHEKLTNEDCRPDAPLPSGISSVAEPRCQNYDEALRLAFARLPDANARLMKLRMGVESEPKTLEEIGRDFGVSRERIRQVESKCLVEMKAMNVWNDEFSRRLSVIFAGRENAVLWEGLEILEPWFVGSTKSPSAFEYIGANFTDRPYFLVRDGLQTFVSRISQQQWDDVVKDGRSLLAGLVTKNVNKADARLLVEGLLPDDAAELQSELWYQVSTKALFSGESDDALLVGFGTGSDSLVRACLEASDTPLHYQEIHRRLVEQGKSVEIRRVHASAANVGLIYGRGTYGLEKHLSLDLEETSQLIRFVEACVGSDDETRQWHASEICELLESEGMDFGGRLNPYVLSIALCQSEKLKPLGRMVWGINSSEINVPSARLDIHQAIVSVLEDAGGSLTNSEILDRVSRARGLNSIFQIQPEGRLVRVGRGLIGLMDRDTRFSSADRVGLMDKMHQVLSIRGKGLHVSEIQSAMMDDVPIVSIVTDPVLFLGLAQKDGRFAVSQSQYVYLPEWGEPRRLSTPAALEQVFREAGHDGLTIDEMVERVEYVLGHSYSKVQFRAIANSLGIQFDPLKGRWILDEETEEMDEPVEDLP